MTNHTDIALIVPADSEAAIVQPFTAGQSYDWLAIAVDGMMDCIRLNHGIDMWVNDEYLYNGSEWNAFATAIYWNTYGAFSHEVRGTAVFTTNDGMGETTGLTIEQFDYLGRMLDEFGILLDLNKMLQA